MRHISSVAETASHFSMKHFSVCLQACVRFALWSPLMKADASIVSSVLGFIFRCTRGDFHLPGFWLCLYARRLLFLFFFFFKMGPHVAATPPVFAVKHLHSSSGHIHLNVSVYENTQSWFILYCLLFELTLYFIPAAEIFSFPQHRSGIIDWHYEGF